MVLLSHVVDRPVGREVSPPVSDVPIDEDRDREPMVDVGVDEVLEHPHPTAWEALVCEFFFAVTGEGLFEAEDFAEDVSPLRDGELRRGHQYPFEVSSHSQWSPTSLTLKPA
jgi:hypothetical protein